MLSIHIGQLPLTSFLLTYKDNGAFTDCYFVDVPVRVTQAEYVEAFYTTTLFKVERMILALLANKPSTDIQAKHLAAGSAGDFAAWRVEQRSAGQLLLCDFLGRTRSWLMTAPGDDKDSTRLYFGSAVIPKSVTGSGQRSFGFAFHALFGFHQLYTRLLLGAALARLLKSKAGQQ